MKLSSLAAISNQKYQRDYFPSFLISWLDTIIMLKKSDLYHPILLSYFLFSPSLAQFKRREENKHPVVPRYYVRYIK